MFSANPLAPVITKREEGNNGNREEPLMDWSPVATSLLQGLLPKGLWPIAVSHSPEGQGPPPVHQEALEPLSEEGRTQA